MDEKISIVIPAYNLESCLGTTLDSVLAQTYQNLEIIVVNDGSTDGTAALIDAYAARDSRIKAVYQENGGVTSARLRGVAKANGSYIGFVDGDDYIEPQMYEQLLANLRTHQADISHCGYQMVFPSRVDHYYNTGRLIRQADGQGCADLLDGTFVEPGLWNKLYRRELFADLDDWMDRTIRINEDLLMNFYLFRRAETTVFEDICPYHYILRQGSAATSRLNEHKLRDPLKVLHLLLAETEQKPDWNRIVERRLIQMLVNMATMPLGNQRDLVAPVRREARKELRKRLAGILSGRSCGIRLKIFALWTALWPACYGWVHRAYAKARGIDKKYEVK